MTDDLARRDREIEQLRKTHQDRAYLIAMAINDWEMEKRAILEASAVSAPKVKSVAQH